jgi:hypothetical protein
MCPTLRLTDAAPIAFDLKPGCHRGIRCSSLLGIINFGSG